MTIATTNPFTGETVKTFSADTDALLEEKLHKAEQAFHGWRRKSFAERAKRMSAAAALLEERKDALGRLMTLEMGKLPKPGAPEIEKCATGCRSYPHNPEPHPA